MPTIQETYVVDDETVCCAGNGGSLGHPAVYLNLMPQGEIVCPYCSRHFILRAEEGCLEASK